MQIAIAGSHITAIVDKSSSPVSTPIFNLFFNINQFSASILLLINLIAKLEYNLKHTKFILIKVA